MHEVATITADDAILAATLAGIGNVHTRRVYSAALRAFFAWRRDMCDLPINRVTVQRYRTALLQGGAGSSTITVALAAIRKLTEEALQCGGISEVDAMGIMRVKGIPTKGVRVGQWLSLEQCRAMLAAVPRETLQGQRDYSALALLIGCGLRRSEAVAARVEQLVLREGRWCLLNLQRKGGRIQTVPVPMWVAEAVVEWIRVSGISKGPILRSFTASGDVSQSLSTPQLYRIVVSSAARIGVKLAAHDCRRTFAGLVDAAGADVRKIQAALGHSSVTTTEKYLDPIRSLRDAACDAVRL